MTLDDLFPTEPTEMDRRAALLVEHDDKFLNDLVAIRRQKSMTQGDVAARMGVSQSAVAHIEGGQRDAKLSTIRRYAMAVGAMVSHHVNDDEEHAEPIPAALVACRDLRQEIFHQVYLTTSGVQRSMTIVDSPSGDPIEVAGLAQRVAVSAKGHTAWTSTLAPDKWIEDADEASAVEDPAEALA